MFGRFGSRPYIQNTSAFVEMPITMLAPVAIAPHLRIETHSGRFFLGSPAGFSLPGFNALGGLAPLALLLPFSALGALHIRKVTEGRITPGQLQAVCRAKAL